MDGPTPWGFAKAFWAHWAERMSGPASVPLVIAALFISNHHAAIGTGVLGIGCGVFAAYRVWSTERSRIVQLEKISRADLQRMLNGRFMGNTFILGGEINFGKRYVSKFELDRLCVDFDRVEVRAPGKAVANIRFRLNAHREWSGKYYVLVRDGLGRVERVENIYDDKSIQLGDDGEFFVKLVKDDDVQFEDGNELWVTIDAWSK